MKMLSGGLRTKGIKKKSQENMPLITVVTVVRNGEKTIEKTILSVINQTYKNVEYIIIDGASNDSTIDIIKKYEDRIDYWKSEPDKGIYDAMNNGIELATGEWINFMNSGDSFCSNEILENIFNVRRDSDVIYGDYILENKIAKIYINAGNLNELRTCKPFCHQSMFIRTSIQKKKKFDCKYKICADYDIIKSIFEANASFEYIPISISLFSSDGISSGVLAYKENAIINGSYKQKYWHINYFFFQLRLYIKIIIKNILPYSIKKKHILNIKKRNSLVKNIWIK